jgi:hypothetical protein
MSGFKRGRAPLRHVPRHLGRCAAFHGRDSQDAIYMVAWWILTK